MINKNQIEPEPLAQIVFVGFSETDPTDRDVYISFKGYTAGYSASPKQREFLDSIEGKEELTESEKRELSEALHYYIKNPDGKFLRFEFEQYGGLKEIDPEKDLNAQKLDWIRYEKNKFIELDGAENVLSFLLFENKGNYRIRKTFLSQDINGDTFTEKPATPEEKELFENVFTHQIEHLYSILDIHDIFSQAGGIAVFNNQHELTGEVSKETLVKAGVKDQAGEQEFMLKYFKEHGLENAYYLPSETRLIPKAFIDKFVVDVEGTDANGNPYTYRELNLESETYTSTLSDAEIALSHAFGSLLDNGVNGSLKSITLQGKIAKVPKFEQILNRTAQQPFIQHYEPEKGKYIKLKPVRISPRKAKEIVLNYIELNAEVESDFFVLLLLSAYRTWKNLYPDEPFTFIDIANILHHPKGKRSSIDSRSKLIKDIADGFDILQTTLCRINFKKQAELSKNNKKFQQYINNGGSGIIKFPFVSGVQRPIKTANGDVLDGIVPDGKQADKLLDFYINMTGQVRTVTGEALTNPLRANKRDLMIFHYLLLKVCSMPYHNKISLFSEKQRYKNLLAGAENEPETLKENDTEKIAWKEDREEQEQELLMDSPEALLEKMLELESKTKKHELTISIDTLLEELKLISPNDKPQKINKLRNTVKGRMENVFEYWKKIDLINGYSENTRPNGRGVQSFTLSFFTEPES